MGRIHAVEIPRCARGGNYSEKNKCIKIFFLLIFILIWPTLGYGLVFDLPKNGDDLVGEAKVTQVKQNEDFSDIAMRFDVGYYEMFEANPGVNPDSPPVNAVLIVPTQYILPLELKK